MSQIVTCPKCGSDRAKLKGYRKTTVSYRCKACGVYYSASKEAVRNTQEATVNATVRDIGNNQREVSGVIPSVAREGGAQGPPTIEETLDLFHVDLSVWEPTDVKINAWNQGARTREGDGFIICNLYQVKIILRRRIAVVTHIPAVQPVYIKSSPWPTDTAQKSHSMRTAMVLSDMHLGYKRSHSTGKLTPFHDRSAFDLAMEVARDEQPDIIILNGDILDCTEWTDKFVRWPEFYFTFQPSLIELRWILERLRAACPGSRIIYSEGNHEKRVPKHMATHLSMAWDVSGESIEPGYPALAIQSLLQLDRIGIEWNDGYPDNPVWLNENVRVIHGNQARRNPGETGRAFLSHDRASVIFGHVHREESVAVTVNSAKGPRTYRAECFGMLGNPERVPSDRSVNDWQQGFGFVHFEDGNGHFWTEKIPIQGGKLMHYRGKPRSGHDYIGNLREDTAWEAF